MLASTRECISCSEPRVLQHKTSPISPPFFKEGDNGKRPSLAHVTQENKSSLSTKQSSFFSFQNTGDHAQLTRSGSALPFSFQNTGDHAQLTRVGNLDLEALTRHQQQSLSPHINLAQSLWFRTPLFWVFSCDPQN